MAVKKVTKGAGIGAARRTQVDLSGPVTRADAEAVLAMLTTAHRQASFEGLVAPVAQWAEGNREHADTTLAALARDVRRLLAETRTEIEAGNVEAAAWAAVKLGAAATTAGIRLEWNTDAQRGRSVRLGSAKRSIETQQAKAARDARIIADYRLEAASFAQGAVPRGWRGVIEKRLADRHQLSGATVRAIIRAASSK